MKCLHNHDQILEFLRKISLKGFQIYQNYLCALKAEVKDFVGALELKLKSKKLSVVSQSLQAEA